MPSAYDLTYFKYLGGIVLDDKSESKTQNPTLGNSTKAHNHSFKNEPVLSAYMTHSSSGEDENEDIYQQPPPQQYNLKSDHFPIAFGKAPAKSRASLKVLQRVSELKGKWEQGMGKREIRNGLPKMHQMTLAKAYNTKDFHQPDY